MFSDFIWTRARKIMIITINILITLLNFFAITSQIALKPLAIAFFTIKLVRAKRKFSESEFIGEAF